MTLVRLRRPHYAWMVCLGGALSLFSTVGLGVNVFTIYQPEIIALRDFTNAQGSWITTTRSLFILVALLTVNFLCRKLGLRLVMGLGTALVGLSCLAFALARSFPSYCFAAALTGLGYCYGGMVPLSLAIGAWFQDRRNLALGLATAGSGVSTIFAPLLITRITRTQGMRAAFLWEGATILVVAVAVLALVRNDPAALGLRPYRAGSAGWSGSAPRPDPLPLSRLQWAVLFFAALLVGGPGGPGFSHLTVLYTSEGYDPVTVAALMSYAGVAICVGKIICGQVYDRLGGRRGNYYAFGMVLVCMSLCCLAPLGTIALPVLAITALGLGLPVSAVSPTVWAADLTSAAGYAGAVRSINIAYTVGVLVFGPMPGILADRLGSYVPAYGLFVLFSGAALLLVQRTYTRAGLR